ncbi:hypothetical protein RD792_011233, partial [Penstemon davidsonii]
SLVKSLEIVDLKKMKREEKLVFWINIHNALVMHAYLAYGTQNYMKSNSMLKAAYNVGGHCINAYDIQNSILAIQSHYSAPWLQNLLSPGKKLKTGTTKHAYAIEYPEPLVHFALCSGSNSDPAVRVYTANNVFNDLKVAKEEFIQATVYVHKETKIYLPRILCYYAKDMSLCMTALLEMVISNLKGGGWRWPKCTALGGLRPTRVVHLHSPPQGTRYRPNSAPGGASWRHLIHFVLLISRQGKVRLTKWYSPYTQKERTKVCELDLIFNFHKAYYILDEILIAGELQESSKKSVARLISAQDSLVEEAKEQASSISNIIAQATK